MDTPDYLRFVAALVFVLALIVTLAWAFRRSGLVSPIGKGRRLALLDSLMLDPRRRMVLVRHDDREFLILLGNSGETLLDARQVESPPTDTAPSLRIEPSIPPETKSGLSPEPPL